MWAFAISVVFCVFYCLCVCLLYGYYFLLLLFPVFNFVLFLQVCIMQTHVTLGSKGTLISTFAFRYTVDTWLTGPKAQISRRAGSRNESWRITRSRGPNQLGIGSSSQMSLDQQVHTAQICISSLYVKGLQKNNHSSDHEVLQQITQHVNITSVEKICLCLEEWEHCWCLWQEKTKRQNLWLQVLKL